MKVYLKAISQIFKITFTILLFITLPVVVFTLVSSKVPVHGIESFVVLTGSMEPTVPVGSVIYTLTRPSYTKGDVIAFKQGNITVTHRVVSVQQKDGSIFYQTKGDANSAVDSALVAAKDVKGMQVYMLLNLGKLILALKTIQGFIAFIIIPSIFLIGFEILNIKKELEKEIRKKILNQFKVNYE